ncbi:MAG: response regulator [bacterium]
MPGGDGLEVCRILRRRGYRAAILLLTALDTVEDKIAGLDAGADDYLTEPFAFPELIGAPPGTPSPSQRGPSGNAHGR